MHLRSLRAPVRPDAHPRGRGLGLRVRHPIEPPIYRRHANAERGALASASAPEPPACDCAGSGCVMGDAPSSQTVGLSAWVRRRLPAPWTSRPPAPGRGPVVAPGGVPPLGSFTRLGAAAPRRRQRRRRPRPRRLRRRPRRRLRRRHHAGAAAGQGCASQEAYPAKRPPPLRNMWSGEPPSECRGRPLSHPRRGMQLGPRGRLLPGHLAGDHVQDLPRSVSQEGPAARRVFPHP